MNEDPPDPEALNALERLLRERTGAAEEREIFRIFEIAPATQLGELIRQVDLRRLFSAMDDRIFGPDFLTTFLELLTRVRVAELGVLARVAIVRQLQAGRTGSGFERAIANLICATRGPELTELKNLIDTTDTHRDLHQLIYSDVDSGQIRAEILSHFDEHSPRAKTAQLKVLSDIDDTFYANWKDVRYPKKTVYPGVCGFYEELDRGPHDLPDRFGDVVFVTARPKDRPGFVERMTHRMLRERGLADPAVLAGSFLNLTSHASMAKKKFHNFQQYSCLFPEYDFVFVGDSGQGDAIFGQQILEAEPDRVRGVFIHDVVETDESDRREWRKKGVSFFDTYVGACQQACELSLVHDEAPARVFEQAQRELEAIAFVDPLIKKLRGEEHQRDFGLAMSTTKSQKQ